MKTLLKIVAIIALLSVLSVAGLISYDFFKVQKAFPVRTFIGKAEVSNLTKEEAIAKLKAMPLSEIYTPLITLEAEGALFSFKPEQLGLSLIEEKAVNNAFSITHRGSYFRRLRERILYGETIAPLMLGFSSRHFGSILSVLKQGIETNPQNASMALYEDTGEYNIEPEEIGRKINIKETYKNFAKAIRAGTPLIPIEIEYTYPKIREKPLRENPPVNLLAEYTTKYGSHDSPNRIHNIKLIASWADGALLMPGETFSAVDLIGVVSPSKGFREAYVIVGGELVPQLGGGACQVATTLYNTAMLADLKIIKRRNHSFYFSIYPLGRDAGIYPGQLDMVFENNTGYPVLIKTTATNKKLAFRIYGQPNGKKVAFSGASIVGRNSKGKYVPMTLKQVIRYNTSFKTFVNRTVKDGSGKVIDKETITSFYRLYGDGTNVPIRRRETY